MAPEKRYEPANKGISEHSSMVPEPEMLNTCLNCHCHIENKGLRGFSRILGIASENCHLMALFEKLRDGSTEVLSSDIIRG